MNSPHCAVTVPRKAGRAWNVYLRDTANRILFRRGGHDSISPWTVVLGSIFGVAIPFGTFVIEAVSHMCAQALFDPIPTGWHVALVLSVPFSNLVAVIALAGNRLPWPRFFLASNSFAIGVGILYAVLFAPITPIGVIAILFGGLGVLPLAPLFGLISAALLRRRVRIDLLDRRKPALSLRWWAGASVALAAVVVLSIPALVTRHAMRKADSPDLAERGAGIRQLRSFGDEMTLLRACYGSQGIWMPFHDDLRYGSHYFPSESARKIYYQVYGRTFDSIPAPRIQGARQFAFDESQGAAAVGGVLPGVSLSQSRIDGSVDAAASLAYVEWTMTFRNADRVQREARTELKLPADSVVSRVTLWINGEEREAAFGKRSQVREAYERVVRAQRDPLLVTTSGPGRVLIQCFPIPPGGEMKIRIGITGPVAVGRADELAAVLPTMTHRNFVTDGLDHEVWIESSNELASSNALGNQRAPDGSYVLRGSINDAAWSAAAPVIRARLSGADGFAWTPDPLDPEGAIIRQRREPGPAAAPQHLIVVVDGSAAMSPVLAGVRQALLSASARLVERYIVASDEVVDVGSPLAALDEFPFAGGTDNIAALRQAQAAATPGSAVLWIHGPQPVAFDGVESLAQYWERRPGSAPLYSFEAVSGANQVLGKFDGVPEVRAVERRGTVREDLERLLHEWGREGPETVVVRERAAAGEPNAAVGKRTSAHLARLWANGEVMRLLATRNAEDREEATELATSYQLVTPVSGAVVLESQGQYEQAGLQPVDSATVPSIPEPEEWMLMFVVAAILLWVWKTRPRAWIHA